MLRLKRFGDGNWNYRIILINLELKSLFMREKRKHFIYENDDKRRFVIFEENFIIFMLIIL